MGWERKRGKLARAQPAAARARPTPAFVPPTGRPPRCPPASATSSRSTPTRGCRAARSRGWSARWRIRSTGRGFDAARGPRRRGLRDPAAARHADAARGPRRLALPADLRPGRAASIPTRPRSPTSTRTSSARARTPARASTTSTPSRRRSRAACPRTRCSATISSRGSSRAPGWSPTSSSSRSSPSHYEVAARAPAPLGARRLAAAALAIRGAPARARGRPDPADRPLEDARQPAPHACRRPPPFLTLVAGWTAAAGARRSCGRAFVLATIALPAAPAGRSTGSSRGGAASPSAATSARVGADLALAASRRSRSPSRCSPTRPG